MAFLRHDGSGVKAQWEVVKQAAGKLGVKLQAVEMGSAEALQLQAERVIE